jgi:hypothetical protein
MFRRFSTGSKQAYKVFKGQSLGESTGGSCKVKLDDSGELVDVAHRMGTVIQAGTKVFVSKPFTRSDFELIAVGLQDAEGKLQFTKYACIHPERHFSNEKKICSNCPRRIQAS